MGKKKIPSIEDYIKNFKEVIKRGEYTSFYIVNNNLICRNPSGNIILIFMDNLLWNTIINDKSFKEEYNLKEVDDNIKKLNINTILFDKEFLTDNWFNISEDIYNGSIFKIKIDGYEYSIDINKELLPLKLKKSEFCNLTYKVLIKPKILCIRKRFDNDINHGFDLIRLFKII